MQASAAKGDDILQHTLTIHGANRIGEIGMGNNYGITSFTKNIHFDEKIGETIHLALGASVPETGGCNESAIHWDILKDIKTNSDIYVDDTLVYKNGQFLI